MLVMVRSHDMHQMSSGLASCRRCNVVAVSANGFNALFICCFSCTGCVKLTTNIKLFALAAWCMQFMMLVISIACAWGITLSHQVTVTLNHNPVLGYPLLYPLTCINQAAVLQKACNTVPCKALYNTLITTCYKSTLQ